MRPSPPLNLVLLFALFALGACSSIPSETRWTMVNVSPGIAQADCHLLEFPDGTNALIDIADGSDAPGTAIAFLQVRKIKHVDLVVITHFHIDHYGRLVDLIKAGISVGRVAINLPANREQMDAEHQGTPLADWDDVQSVLQFLRDRKVPYFTPKAGDRLVDISRGGSAIRLEVLCLYDGVNTPVGKTDINDTSIILRLSHGPTRALFTGDLNNALGTYLAKSELDLKADVLKVPHHGTEGVAPNEFFDRVGPKAALVPGPSQLWLSDRSKRIRDYFAGKKIPTYISGINGHVTVVLTARGFTVTSERVGP